MPEVVEVVAVDRAAILRLTSLLVQGSLSCAGDVGISLPKRNLIGVPWPPSYAQLVPSLVKRLLTVGSVVPRLDVGNADPRDAQHSRRSGGVE